MDTLGGSQTMVAVTESGLYALVMTSRKPSAKRFRKWVTSQVLPAIRRTGHFRVEQEQVEVPVAVIDHHRLIVNRAYLASLSKAHQATAHARAANLREIATMVEAGVPRRAAMDAVSAQCGIPKNTLYAHLRLIRMVPEPDWPAALAPQWNKGALTRLADKAFDRRRIRGRAA